MFRCENLGCTTVTNPRQPENRIITETRSKTYENEIKRGKNKGTIMRTSGSEIVKEIRVCPSCYQLLTGLQPRKVEPTRKARPKKSFLPADNRGKKKWVNPKKKQKFKQAKDTDKPRRTPIVEVVNPLPIVKE